MLKFSDIMLDLDTGDASMHDVYAKEALNKVKVASAIFEYAVTLSEQKPGSAVIQEAAEEAEEAGLPTEPAEAPALATEAVQQELGAFYDVLVANAKKVNAAAKRDMAAFIGLGKKYGVSASAAKSGSFFTSFASPIAQALTREFAKNRKVGNSIKFKKGVFPTAYECEKLIFAYGNAMASLGAVFGLGIGDSIEDPTVQDILGLNKNFIELLKGGFRATYLGGDVAATSNPVKGFAGDSSTDLGKLYKNMLRGTNYSKFEMGKLATTKSASTGDIAHLITYIYVALQVSKGIVDAAKGAGKKKEAMAFIAQVCADEANRHAQSAEKGQKKIATNLKKLNDSMSNWAEDVEKVSDLVVKAFSDATSALGKVATGEGDGIVDEGGSAESGETAGSAEE